MIPPPIKKERFSLHANIVQDIDTLASSLTQPDENTQGNGSFSRLAEAIATELKSAARPEVNFDNLRQLLQANLNQAEHLSQKLQVVLTNLDRLEQAHRHREKYSARWWDQTMDSFNQAFKRDPAAGYQQWLLAYSEALIDWNLEASKRLANAAYDFPADQMPYVLLVHHGDAALQEKSYPSSMQMLDYLTGYLRQNPQGDSNNLAMMLLIFMARIHQNLMENPGLAHQEVEQAAALVPRDGRPIAALGQHAMAFYKKGWAEASKLFSRAIELSPDQPDGYVGMAMLAEARGEWHEADDWYKNAIEETLDEVDLVGFLSKLLAPGSGRLNYHAAQQLKDQNPTQALSAVELCLSKGMEDGTTYPLRAAKALKANIYAAFYGAEPHSKQARTIAMLYMLAADDYTGNSEYTTAVDLYRKGRHFDSMNGMLLFNLADILRVVSQTDKLPYYSSEEEVRECLSIWEEAYELTPEIDANTAWVYTARARISQQLGRLPDEDTISHTWQTILYTEQSLLLQENSDYWPTLGASYDDLSLNVNMLAILRKMAKSGLNTVYSKEERARALVNTGQFKQAAVVINQLLHDRSIEAKSKILYRSWMSMVNYYQGDYLEGLKNLELSLQSDPENMWAICAQASLYYMSGNEEAARKIDERVWKQKNIEKYKDFTIEFAWSAFRLGYYKEAFEKLESLLNNPYAEEFFIGQLVAGLCHLALNQFQQAEQHLTTALKNIKNPRQSSDFLIGLDVLKRQAASKKWPHQEELLNFLNQPDSLIAKGEKINKVTSAARGNPIKELQRALADPLLGNPGSWSWLGAQASLGRLYLDTDRLRDAVTTYQALMQYPEKMREAKKGLAQAQEKITATQANAR